MGTVDIHTVGDRGYGESQRYLVHLAHVFGTWRAALTNDEDVGHGLMFMGGPGALPTVRVSSSISTVMWLSAEIVRVMRWFSWVGLGC